MNEINPTEVIRERAESHMKAMADGDHRTALNDLYPDRWKQIAGSLRLPSRIVATEAVDISMTSDGQPVTTLRYTGEDGEIHDVRSQWGQLADGSWRIYAARNVPVRLPKPVGDVSESDLGYEHLSAMNEDELKIQRCNDCQKWIWGPRHLCPSCHSFDLGYKRVTPEGRIYSWSRTTQPFDESVAGRVPYVMVLTESPQAGGVRVLGLLAESEERDPVIGESVTAVFEDVGAGRKILRWQFAEASNTSNGKDRE